ncbi:breast cancer metastasis-suppressor 1 isoform X1 [Ambystoma mexicanum]|uniref:breast cancer metastasis-suppressor 1 isoform X1 n=1 Tax=Ambystoma mexicanum TaxID=8296 RepID=UPI0037E99202
MPVGPESKEAEEMEADGDSTAEMNGDDDESEEDHTGSQSDTEEESSEMDDEDCERRRTECLDEMSDLEKQFAELKEKPCRRLPRLSRGASTSRDRTWRLRVSGLFKERLQQVKAKLEEVAAGKAAEYIDPLAVLQKNMKIRIEVAGIYRGLCLEVIKNRHDCELQGAKQHLESEKLLLFDNMQSQLLERIQRLEEDRQSIDITSEWWDDELRTKRNRKKWDPFKPEKKKKPPLISGPYIVYMLSDLDILEDWTAIKKVGESVKKHVCCPLKPCRRVSGGCESLYQAKAAAVSPQKRKSDAGLKTDKQQFSARCEDGQLHYEGESFCKGQNIVLEIKDEPPSHAIITAVSTGEVWLRRRDGSKTKIYVSQLQKGKYSVRRA